MPSILSAEHTSGERAFELQVLKRAETNMIPSHGKMRTFFASGYLLAVLYIYPLV